MRIPGGRRTCRDLLCEPRKQKRNWSRSEPLFEKSKSERKNENVSGGVSVDAVAVSCVGDIVDEEGVSFKLHMAYMARLHIPAGKGLCME